MLNAFNEATEFAHIAVDRMHLSRLVYAQHYQRKEFTNAKLRTEAEAEFMKFMVVNDTLLVYVKAEVSVLEERMRKRGEDPAAGPDSAISLLMFEQWIKQLGFVDRVLTIDTTFNPAMPDLTSRITGKIKSLQRGR